MTVIGAGAALASLVLHFTEQGSDSFGCDSETLMMSGKFNTNKHCTREMAACNFLPKYITKASDRNNASVACNEAVSGRERQSLKIDLHQNRSLSNGFSLFLSSTHSSC